MTATKVYEILVWLLNGIAALWRKVKPRLELGVLWVQILFLDICEAHKRAIDRLAQKLEEELFTGGPKTSRLFAHLFFGTGVIVGTILAISGIEFLVKVHIPWVLSLNVEQGDAWAKLNCVFLVCEIIVGRSIIKRGIIRTILKAVAIVLGIKCATALLAFSLTWNFSIDTPMLDNIITIIVKGIDVIIIQFTQWLIENIHIVFG
mgnify:FL=1